MTAGLPSGLLQGTSQGEGGGRRRLLAADARLELEGRSIDEALAEFPGKCLAIDEWDETFEPRPGVTYHLENEDGMVYPWRTNKAGAAACQQAKA